MHHNPCSAQELVRGPGAVGVADSLGRALPGVAGDRPVGVAQGLGVEERNRAADEAGVTTPVAGRQGTAGGRAAVQARATGATPPATAG